MPHKVLHSIDTLCTGDLETLTTHSLWKEMQQRQHSVSKSPVQRLSMLCSILWCLMTSYSNLQSTGRVLRLLLTLCRAEDDLLDRGTVFHHLHSMYPMQQCSNYAHHNHHQPIPQLAHVVLKRTFEVNNTLFLRSYTPALASALPSPWSCLFSGLFHNDKPPTHA